MYGCSLGQWTMGRRSLGMERNVNYDTLPVQTLGRRNRRWHMHGQDPDLNAYLNAIYTAAPVNISSIGASSWRIDSKARWALNELVKSLKGEGLWTLMVGVYPLIAGRYGFSTANWANSYNLKDATLKMTFSSGITFDQNSYGVINTGSTQVATMLSNTRSELSNNDNNWHVSLYGNRRKGQGLNTMYGLACASGAGTIDMIFDDTSTINLDGNAINLIATSTDTHGYFIGTRRSSTDMSLFRNGILLKTVTTTASTNLPTVQLFTFGSLTANTQYSQYMSFLTVGFGLTDNQSASLTDIVERFNCRMGRSTT